MKFLGDLALLEIAAEGFERRLFTLVQEGEAPDRGTEVGMMVDPESVLVFPAESAAESEGDAGPPRAEMP